MRVPDLLLRMYAHDPLTIGVYIAVARCAVAEGMFSAMAA